jgi:hypothetical protein
MGLVAARYRDENVIEGMEIHALTAEINSFLSRAQLSVGGHDPATNFRL